MKRRRGSEVADLSEPTAFVDDDSWAQPRSQAGKGWKAFAVVLASAAIGLSVFAVGTRYGRAHPATTTAGRGGLGGGFGGGGFGGAGFPGANGAGAGGNGGTGTGGLSAAQLAVLLGTGTNASQAGASPSPAQPPSVTTVRGTVTAADAKSVTVRSADGKTTTFSVSAGSQFGKRARIAIAEVVAGQDVEVSLDAADATTISALTVGELSNPVVAASGPSSEPTPQGSSTTTTIDSGLGGLLPG